MTATVIPLPVPARTGSDHPCLSCPLPDCDDTANGCALRVALRAYKRLQWAGQPIPDGLKRAYGIAYAELYRGGMSS